MFMADKLSYFTAETFLKLGIVQSSFLGVCFQALPSEKHCQADFV